MKNIPKPELSGCAILSAAEMNKIHFGGNHTPLTAEQLKKMGESPASSENRENGPSTTNR